MSTPAPPSDIDCQRQQAAAWLLGHPRDPRDPLPGISFLVHEGVVGWAYARAHEAGDAVPAAWRMSLAGPAREAAICHLRATDAARHIQRALDAAGIPAIWLKGIALGQWLYPDPHQRDIGDIDLLLPDHATTLRAAGVLAPLGYTLPNPHIAGDLVVHELLAWSSRAGLELDLHWDVSNGALFAGRLPWQALWERARPLPALGPGARGLGDVDACLHASLHRAANRLTGLHDRLRWLLDVHLLAQRFDAAGWQACVQAAIAAKLADPLLSALAASSRLLGTEVPPPVMAALRTAAAGEDICSERLGSWSYFQWSCWRRLPGLRMRLRWLRQLLFPDMAHLRVRYGADGAGALVVRIRRLRDGWRRWRGWARPRESL
jgi:hypothetical protein